MGKFIIVPDNDQDEFTPSLCECSECSSMNNAINEWDGFQSNTHLQRRMKSVIARIEKKYTVKKPRKSDRDKVSKNK